MVGLGLATYRQPLVDWAWRDESVTATLTVDGMNDVAAIERAMRQALKQEPTIHVEYLAVCNPGSLEPLPAVATHAVLLGAVRIGSIRLIDNLLVKISS